MEKLLFLLLAQVSVPLCSGQAPSCSDYPCPKYQLIQKNQDFEERLYVDTQWVSTRVSSRDGTALMSASKTLRAFCDQQKAAGHEVIEGWPALITLVEGAAPSTSLSWFLGTGSEPQITDTSVTLEHRAASTVYVRAYSGTPSLAAAEENKEILFEALAAAGKKFNPNVCIGAHYESYFALTHHNEVWVYSG